MFRLVSFVDMPSPLPRQRPWRLIARTPPRLRPSPSVGRVGSCIGCFGACSVFTSHYGLRDLPSRLEATLYTRGSGSFVASATAPIASGWSEPVPGRDFQPAVDQRLNTAHQHALARNPSHLYWYRSSVREVRPCAARGVGAVDGGVHHASVEERNAEDEA